MKQVIYDETRETSLAGIVPGDIQIFEHFAFNTQEHERDGWGIRTGLNIRDMKDFNDEASSCIIYSGVWEFWNDDAYQHPYGPGPGTIRLGPGYYRFLPDVGIDNDTLTSVRQVG